MADSVRLTTSTPNLALRPKLQISVVQCAGLFDHALFLTQHSPIMRGKLYSPGTNF